ncbi:MAG TPA: hypothetical protein PK759_04150, partial [Spirochaetales bacterium]|nr:hypothetical protein [Spirochaetales bacterium]HPS14973.1 hypothetical protein [Spirochaetales bacterium]
ESILNLMKRMNREYGTTFIFSTHDPGIVEMADHVIRLKDGAVIENRRRVSDESSSVTIIPLVGQEKGAEEKIVGVVEAKARV